MPIGVPIQFGAQSYESVSRPWSSQRLVNWFAETAPNAKTKSPLILLPRPGLSLFSTVGDGPIRGAIQFLGVLYVVSGTSLYSIDEGGTATGRGTISGVGYVTMDVNTTQICIVARPNAWIYTPATTTLTQVTDVDFPGSAAVTELDGYFIHAEPNDTGRFFVSNLDDGLNFDALNFATAESDADPLVRPFAQGGELLLFGQKTLEVWDNPGGGGFPFTRSAVSTIDKGLIALFSLAKADNTAFFVGSDKICYRLSGYTPVRISNHGIEDVIAATPDPSDIIGFSYVDRGHTLYVITSASGEWTLAFDVATGLWHNRATYPNDFWAVTTFAECYNKQLVGDSSAGRVYEMDIADYEDNDDTIRYECTSPPIFEAGNVITMSRLYVDFEVGAGLTTGQGSNPQAMLQWSDDGGRTWSNEHWRSMGRIGEYRRRVTWRKLGQFRERIFRLSVSDPIGPKLLGAYADYEVTPA